MNSERSSCLIKSWTAIFLRSLQRRGFAGTVKYGTALIAYSIRSHFPSSWDDYVERHFDRKFAVDTAGTVYLPELRTDPRYRDARFYGTCSCFFIRRALKSLPVDHREFTFVDMGCGKGKAMLVASDWPFRQIIGVEISSILLEVAERNIATYRGRKKGCRDFRLLCMDARAYEIPPGNLVLYFFNPFEEPLMREVLENVARSVAQCPREVFVIYKYPMLRPMMESLPFLSLVRESPWYRIYKVLPRIDKAVS
jgi:SAM-dependent methyltransferase